MDQEETVGPTKNATTGEKAVIASVLGSALAAAGLLLVLVGFRDGRIGMFCLGLLPACVGASGSIAWPMVILLAPREDD